MNNLLKFDLEDGNAEKMRFDRILDPFLHPFCHVMERLLLACSTGVFFRVIVGEREFSKRGVRGDLAGEPIGWWDFSQKQIIF